MHGFASHAKETADTWQAGDFIRSAVAYNYLLIIKKMQLPKQYTNGNTILALLLILTNLFLTSKAGFKFIFLCVILTNVLARKKTMILL